MLDIMHEIPKDDNIGMVMLTKSYIENTGGPIITMRSLELSGQRDSVHNRTAAGI